MAENKKVLMVDDDLFRYARNFVPLMAKYGVDYYAAEDFDGALDMIKQHKFDLILLDFQLAGYKNGLEALAAIREIDKVTPIHMLSAYEEHDTKAFELGANKYVLKPLDWKEHILKPLGITVDGGNP